MNKKFTCFFILIMFSSFCTTQSSAEEEVVLNYYVPSLSQEFDSFHATSVDTFTWQSATMVGLYSRSSENGYDFVPTLALGEPTVEIVSDEMVVTTSLNPDYFFSNGDPVTAEDVAFTYQLLLDDRVNKQTCVWNQFNPYTSDYLSQFFQSNESIIALDTSTISFTFSEVSPLYKKIISAPIINKNDRLEYLYNHGFYDFNDPEEGLANGAGPYMVESLNWSSHEYVLTKNVFWGGSEQQVDKIVFSDKLMQDLQDLQDLPDTSSILATNQVHIIAGNDIINDFTNIIEVNSSYAKDITMNDPRSFFIGYNHDNRYINGSFTPLGINDPTQAEAAGIKVRKAISAAIPRDLIEEFYSGNVGLSKSFLPEVNSEWEANLTVRAYDIDKAILLMESAGYDYSTDVDLSHEVNENNSLFTLYLISLDTGGPGWYYTQAHLLEQELPKIGINVVHQLLGWNFYDFTLFSPDRPSVGAISEEGDLLGWDLLSYSHLFDFDYDIRNILDSSSLRPNGDNFYNYENTEWDNLVEEYSSLSNLSLRKEKTYELKLFLNENEPITPTFTLQDNYIVFNTVSNYDNVLLSINALEWEKLTIATLSKGDEAGMGFISAIIGVALLPIIKKKVNWRN